MSKVAPSPKSAMISQSAWKVQPFSTIWIHSGDRSYFSDIVVPLACEESREGVLPKESTFFLVVRNSFGRPMSSLFLVFFIGLLCISPSNKIVIIHEARCSYVPPLSLLFYVHKQVSHLTTKACFLFKWTYITMPTQRRGERINWLDAQVSYSSGVLTRSGHFCPTLGALHPLRRQISRALFIKG